MTMHFDMMRKVQMDKVVKQGQTERERLHEKTFRLWCNKYLQSSGIRLDNLIGGFTDGVNLVRLVENLTKEKINKKIRTNPTMEVHKLENVSAALDFVKKYAPDIDVAPREIVEKQTKMVLGFVWQLIVRFQILAGDKAAGGANVMRKAREKVLNWWRTQLEEYAPDITIDKSVENSFGDGMAILALIHKLNPDFVDLEAARKQRDENGFDGRFANLKEAFALAEKHLKIVPLLDPADMIAEESGARPDEQCILTYVSEFAPAFLAVYDGAAAAERRRAELEAMRAEMIERRRVAEAELERLRQEKANSAVQSEDEKRRLQMQAELRAETIRQEYAEKARLEAEQMQEELAKQQAITSEQINALKAENEEKIKSLQQAMINAEHLSAKEKARLEAERAAEIKRLQDEADVLGDMLDEELRQQKLEMERQLKESQEALKREAEEREAEARMTKQEYDEWKAKRVRELDQLRAERDAMAAAVHAEIARLRAENDRLRRGEPHEIVKRSFSSATWCHMCRGYLFTGRGRQCVRTACHYVICLKCMKSKGAPNNCLGDQVRGGIAPTDKESAKKLEDEKELYSGWLRKKGYSTGRWNKRWFVLKRGSLMYFANPKAAAAGAEKRKGVFMLKDCHLVKYTKEKKKLHAFGVESKNACLWLGADTAQTEEAWLNLLDQAIIRTDQAKKAEQKLEQLFAAAAEKDKNAAKAVRLKGGTMLISRSAVQAAVSAAKAGVPFGADVDIDDYKDDDNDDEDGDDEDVKVSPKKPLEKANSKQKPIWKEAKSKDGRIFYFNRITRKSQWKKPSNFDELMPLNTSQRKTLTKDQSETVEAQKSPRKTVTDKNESVPKVELNSDINDNDKNDDQSALADLISPRPTSPDEANDNEETKSNSTTESIQNDTAQTTKEEQAQDAELTQIDENKSENTVSNDKETTTVSPMSQLPDLPETPNQSDVDHLDEALAIVADEPVPSFETTDVPSFETTDVQQDMTLSHTAELVDDAPPPFQEVVPPAPDELEAAPNTVATNEPAVPPEPTVEDDVDVVKELEVDAPPDQAPPPPPEDDSDDDDDDTPAHVADDAAVDDKATAVEPETPPPPPDDDTSSLNDDDNADGDDDGGENASAAAAQETTKQTESSTPDKAKPLCSLCKSAPAVAKARLKDGKMLLSCAACLKAARDKKAAAKAKQQAAKQADSSQPVAKASSGRKSKPVWRRVEKEGKVFYRNRLTKVSVWKKPDDYDGED